jgi:O-antigen/teichoic acid export membrane protein
LLPRFRELTRNLALYGLGDVAVSIVSFLLLPLYVLYLTPEDYGVLALLGSVEVLAKIAFRLGLDGSFMRFYYDYDDPVARRRLASTIFFFLLAVNGALLALSVLLSPWLGDALFGSGRHLRALQLTLLNTFAIGFTFFPFHLMRMEKRAAEFSALALARSVSTLVLRIVLVVGAGLGVMGVVLADTFVTAVLMLVLVRYFRPLIARAFSRAMLADSLRFGLPRVPHALAQQVVAVGDKFILSALRPLHEVGVYSIGVSFGLTQKLFLSAFEYAWAPFYYENARSPDAKRLFSSMATYTLAMLALMTAGLSALGRDLIAAVTHSEAVHYVQAAEVVTWTAVGVFFQGVYLLTSIGLNLTKHTQYYPVATTAAAATNIGLNFALVPRYGMVGAAWANAAAYAVQAALAYRFSQRFYPIEYETGRIGLVIAAAVTASLCARALPAMPPIAGLGVRGATVVLVYGAILVAAGFLRPGAVPKFESIRRGPRVEGPAPEVTELGGEIVSAAVLPEALAAPPEESQRR